MFGSVPKNLWGKRIEPDDENCIPLVTRSLWITYGDRRILVDCGMGELWSEPQRRIHAIRNIPEADWGFDPESVTDLILTHLHFDHAGGNELVPNATMVVQKREWQAAQDPETAAKVGFFRADFDHGHPVKQVEGEHDLFGDGSVICIPTYGHTPGHQSLKVRTEAGEIVITGDACYFCRTLRERRLPRFVYDREQMLASLDRLEALEKSGARLFFGHDPDFWKNVPQAPVPAF